MDIDPQAFGKNGAANVNSGAGVTAGNWYAIQMIGDTTLSALTATNDSGATLAGDYPSGFVLYGNFRSITVTSGLARCYKTAPIV
jgi:hypothetical protein